MTLPHGPEARHEPEAARADSREITRPEVFAMLLAYKTTAGLTTGIELGLDNVERVTNRSARSIHHCLLEQRQGFRLSLD